MTLLALRRYAFLIAKNDIFHEYTNYIENSRYIIRHHFVRDTIDLYLVSFINQIVDVFTKAHPPTRFHDLLAKLHMASFQPWGMSLRYYFSVYYIKI